MQALGKTMLLLELIVENQPVLMGIYKAQSF